MLSSVVVGSSGGIGTAIVARLKKAGHRVLGVDRVPPAIECPVDDFVEVDLTNESSTRDACRSVREMVQPIWGLVYCAGVYPILSFSEYTVDLWNEVHAVNVTGAFIVTSELRNAISSGGRIITVVSGAAHVGSRDHTCHTLRTPNAKKALTIPVIPLCDNACDEDEHGHAR